MGTWEDHLLLRMMIFAVSRLMPVWILLCAATAFRFHAVFIGLGSFVGLEIGCVMFLMGMTLDVSRLVPLLKKSWPVVFGSIGKWVFAPVIGAIVAAVFFGTQTATAAGIVMAGIVPSGTSANLNSLIGGGDVAYSVAMSAMDTLVGPLSRHC